MPIIQAVERALLILDLFDERTPELKITEISARMGLHKSTVHSLVKTLQGRGYMEQDVDTGKYRLGLRLIEKGQQLLQSMDIRQVAKTSLEQYTQSTGQTTHLVILDGDEGVYIDKVEGDLAPIRYSRVGRRVMLHTSSVGKLLCAYQPENWIEGLLERYDFVRLTEKTIIGAAAFRRELELVRLRGYSIDDEENEIGVRCAAVPVFDHHGLVSAAISVSTLRSRVDDQQLERLIVELNQAAAGISQKLGHRA
ncbi:DNA-binding IclR family transcriptional regulator [Paenibacillus endophyticus]|uniref:Glycerol operon regulatory protein n=1 Tax=Paenibacillus endophyticus TaxID=1294268 RepID=A0A7W5C408_9BACL|nr:IclR family transcriptional regulator [Paenibacillus endophyticus]MBB3150472.1 DNA-binding IclR family transcriptional regulator [Paenibacillus endophyticus]